MLKIGQTMTVKKNEHIEVMANEQAYQISAWKALSIVGGAVIVSVVGTAFAIGSTLNNDHFLLLRTNERVVALEDSTVREDVLIEQLQPMRDDIAEMKADIKVLVRETRAGE